MHVGKVLYIDLDNVLVDFPSALLRVEPSTIELYEGQEDDIPGIFALMKPLPRG